MPLPLIPGTLQPGQNNYPMELQSLVNLLAANLFTTETPKEFFRHNSPNQVPTDSLWADLRDGTLKFQDSGGTWVNARSGNFYISATPTNGLVSAGTNIFNSAQSPNSTRGIEIANLSVRPFSPSNRMFVAAHVPAVCAGEENINVYATLVRGSTVVSITSETATMNNLRSMFVMGIDSFSAGDIQNGLLSYRLRLGTDDATAQVYYNRKHTTDTFNNFMRVTMFAVEVPV